MRTFVTGLLVFLGSLVTFQPGRADDEAEKERREKAEKELAKLEPDLEKEELAIKNKKSIAEITKLLDNADQTDLFRLNPERRPDGNKGGKKEFHQYGVRSELRVESKEDRKAAAAFLGKTLHWNPLRGASCFNPRHGLRLVSGKRTLDFLICFECNRVEVFEDGMEIATLTLTFTDKDNPIERLLAASEMKAKDQK